MSTAINVKNKVLFGGVHRMTLDYGYTYSDGSFHKGVDLVVGNYQTDYVCAIEDGTVVSAANNIKGTNSNTGTAGMGNYVILQHANGWRTRYQHMEYKSVLVKKGDVVKKGQKLGKMGNTGFSRGMHLHFDISNATKQSKSYYAGQRYYVDPKPFLYGTRSIKGTTASNTNGVKPVTYVTTADLNVRKGPGTNYGKVSFKKMSEEDQIEIKKIAGKSKNYYPRGMSFTVSSISGTWGRTTSGWVSLNYAKKK